MHDLLVLAATVATAVLVGSRLFAILLARFEPDRPYWEALGEVSGRGCGSCPAAPVRVVGPAPFDWERDGGVA